MPNDLGPQVGERQQACGKSTRHHKSVPVEIDKRFAVGRRVKQLAITFRERLNLDANPDPLLLAAVERAARLTALAEQASARALSGDERVAYDDVVRLSRLADHAVRRLHLDQHNAKQQPSLSSYLAARGEQP